MQERGKFDARMEKRREIKTMTEDRIILQGQTGGECTTRYVHTALDAEEAACRKLAGNVEPVG
jgi:hypothetical protein